MWAADAAQTRTRHRTFSLALCRRGHTNTRGSYDPIGNSFSVLMLRHQTRRRYNPKSTAGACLRGRANAYEACGRHCIDIEGYLTVAIHGLNSAVSLPASVHRVTPPVFPAISIVIACHTCILYLMIDKQAYSIYIESVLRVLPTVKTMLSTSDFLHLQGKACTVPEYEWNVRITQGSVPCH